jgi:hypothetical protein
MFWGCSGLLLCLTSTSPLLLPPKLSHILILSYFHTFITDIDGNPEEERGKDREVCEVVYEEVHSNFDQLYNKLTYLNR